MKRSSTIEYVVDRLVTARHPSFRSVDWRPVEEAYEFQNSGSTAPRVRWISREDVPLSDEYQPDRGARPNLPNTWQSIAAVAVRATGLAELHKHIDGSSIALYRLLPMRRLEMGDLKNSDVATDSESHNYLTRVHGIRLGLTGGRYGIGVSSPEGELFTLPFHSLIPGGPIPIRSLEQDTNTFRSMRFS